MTLAKDKLGFTVDPSQLDFLASDAKRGMLAPMGQVDARRHQSALPRQTQPESLSKVRALAARGRIRVKKDPSGSWALPVGVCHSDLCAGQPLNWRVFSLPRQELRARAF